ncbi:MAG: MBL fold metallo-hydrolase [Leptospiraceae bacterium]|nr:MBL fold metallo-hydrolase [Leptospiraceae bacterium]
MAIVIETFPVYPLGCNCSIVSCEETKEAIIVDPGGDENKILQYVSENNLKVKQIIHTHAHFDHCLGTSNVAKHIPGSKIRLHKDDLELYDHLDIQCRAFGIHYDMDEVKPIDDFLEDTEILSLGKSSNMEVIHTPGHSPGSVCFSIQSSEYRILFSGDTLFAGSIGRTDLWGGNYTSIIKSIKTRLMHLDDDTVIIPGHGEKSVIYNEKKYNPYIN